MISSIYFTGTLIQSSNRQFINCKSLLLSWFLDLKLETAESVSLSSLVKSCELLLVNCFRLDTSLKLHLEGELLDDNEGISFDL